jgi:DedD protein
MNQGMRQRLLGILVLVALASILLPLLLDFRSGYPVDTSSRIPPPPEIPARPLPQLDAAAPPPEDDQAAAAPRQPFQLPEAASESEVPDIAAIAEEPGLDEAGLPKAWVLQLGAFQEERNALELRDRLVAAGHRAFVQRSADSKPVAYRVFVGPKMTRDQLSAAQRELEREFQIKPLVVPFAP